jgi:hypothetical protein
MPKSAKSGGALAAVAAMTKQIFDFAEAAEFMLERRNGAKEQLGTCAPDDSPSVS